MTVAHFATATFPPGQVRVSFCDTETPALPGTCVTARASVRAVQVFFAPLRMTLRRDADVEMWFERLRGQRNPFEDFLQYRITRNAIRHRLE
jgi:hypothetical protein